jgi:hypothetical protein
LCVGYPNCALYLLEQEQKQEVGICTEKGRSFKVTDQSTERLLSSVDVAAGPGLVGEVMGHGLFRMAPGDVPALRRRPGPLPEGWGRVPPSLLRYADEQTIAATASVFAAIAVMGSHPDRFHDWGVVVASRYLGRANLATALRSFRAEGVWGTSPHLIPHFALHSPSGTISLALGSHGPNLGVGGGLHGAAEGFLAALSWLSAGTVPGVWLVFSGWSPELVPDPSGNPPSAGECLALAMAVVGTGTEAQRPGLRAVVRAERHHVRAPLDLPWLAERLERPEGRSSRTIASDPRGHLRIELVGGSD